MLEQLLQRLNEIRDNRELFRNELIKSAFTLKTYEFFRLRKMVKDDYGKTHGQEIADAYEFLLYN